MKDPVPLVPPDMVPAWGDMPRLSWVLGRAYAPRRPHRWLGAVVAVVTFWLWVVLLVPIRRNVAADARRALLTVTPVKDPRAVWAVGAVAMAGLVGAFVWQSAEGSWVPAVLIAVLLAWSVLALEPWRYAATQRSLWRLYRDLRQAAPDAPIYELGTVAAWPPGAKAGRRLVQRVLDETPLTEGYLIVIPRNDTVRDLYLGLELRRHRFQRHETGALYVPLPAAGGPYSSSP